ncbi:ATP-binding response regulator [Pseudobacteriovorax antillogorgiicola]|uniref:ATP-binding response regulator n=1 Tax=Pseudobacteriovorax antillogorgiicola TaxID=1513793 RepID=UPI00135643C2|nr:hybrid sensor histidine kinase/response regulator [Pseudobacteriovorax antillogorgiicola]
MRTSVFNLVSASLGILLAFVLLIGSAIDPENHNALAITFLADLIFLSMFGLNYTKKIPTAVASYITITTLLLTIFSLGYLGRGLQSPVLVAIVGIPILATLLLGWKQGFIFTIGSIGSIVVLYFTRPHDFNQHLYGVRPENWVPIFILSLASTTIAILIFFYAFETTRAKHERKLNELNRKLSETLEDKVRFFSLMSHDLRTPINSIIGYSELIDEDLKSGSYGNIHKDLHSIHQSGKHMLALVNDLLDLTKTQAGQMQFSPSTFDLQEFFQDLNQTCTAIYPDHHNTLRMDINVNGIFYAPQLRLKQLITNLISNAMKFTDHGLVVVTATLSNSHPRMLKCTVQDNGIGISDDEQTKIFDAFKQNNGKLNHMSAGLGLPLVKTMIEAMNGRITVKSELSIGSQFTIELPEFLGAPITLSDSKPTVLLVDDDTDVLDLLSEYLVDDGIYAVQTARSGLDAIDLLKIRDFDIIIIDYQMPDMNGWELLQKIRAQNLSPKAVCIFSTGIPQMVDRAIKDALNLKVLAKPFSYETLKQAIEDVKSMAA